MFISVDFPAPFSPSRAWISPRRRSKSTRSLARTPGNRFVIPRSSSTTSRSAMRSDSKGVGRGPPPRTASGLDVRLDDDPAGGDELADGNGPLDELLRHFLVDGPEAHA